MLLRNCAESADRVFFFLLVVGLAACVPVKTSLEERLEAAMEDRLRQCQVKGASAAVILPDGVVRTVTAGYSHDDVRMDPGMAFSVGSITKNVVSALVLQLVEEGVLSLDDPVAKWLPPYPHVDGSVTLRQLLSHTSGIYMFFESQRLWDDLLRDRERRFTPEEVLGYLEEPDFAPGHGFRYSNTNYLLAAMIIERATGSTLAVELRRRFWEPLGLESARLPLEEPYPEQLAHVWGDNFEGDGSFRDLTFLPRISHDSIGCPSVFMTARDLARWSYALFHGQVIAETSLAQMEAFGDQGSYGLGLQRFSRLKTAGQRAWGHGGGSIGSEAYVAYLPDHDVTLALMINRFGGEGSTLILRELAGITMMRVKPSALVLSVQSLQSWQALTWVLAGAGALLFAVRRQRPAVLFVLGGLALVAGWVSSRHALFLEMILVPEALLLVSAGIFLALKQRLRKA